MVQAKVQRTTGECWVQSHEFSYNYCLDERERDPGWSLFEREDRPGHEDDSVRDASNFRC